MTTSERTNRNRDAMAVPQSGSSRHTAGMRCGLLLAAAVVTWATAAVPAWWLGGRAGLEGLTVAAVLCLLPGFLVFLFVSRMVASENQLSIVVLGGAGLRMLFVLAGMLAVQSLRPDLGFREFVVWLLVFYLAMLATETVLVLKRPAA